MSDTPETDAFITSQDYSPTGHQWRNFTRKLERERDEALMDRGNGDIATMTRNHYERILRERDEAREQAQRLRVQLNHYTQANEMAEQAFRERDEARESLRILAGLVAYGLGQSGEEWSLEAMRQATTAIQNAKSLEDAK